MWSYKWNDVRRYIRPTGMIWKGGTLWYKHPPNPPTLFNHILCENLKMVYLSQRKVFDVFPKNPLLATRKSYMPMNSGKTIQFFTYAESSAP